MKTSTKRFWLGVGVGYVAANVIAAIGPALAIYTRGEWSVHPLPGVRVSRVRDEPAGQPR
ncbi:hypothetical protein GCM10025865_18190 [Paraoerskovia sediminicola]|uniref:Uncharacterized protein n=1 Tax=Paraoerskovia sediminicola TaxID=1138587 RepID=A0ABM8G338_9CELL|nr:hypothetical protein [Paraoerskovia sediminicola]BDZ42520.1 hypothetical protein GCM10025865_18190 [Paraoerskovia sediminicola]